MNNRLAILIDILIDAASVSQPLLPAEFSTIAAFVCATVWLVRWMVRCVKTIRHGCIIETYTESRVEFTAYVERDVPESLHADAVAAFDRSVSEHTDTHDNVQ